MTPLIKCEMRWKRKMMMMKVMEMEMGKAHREAERVLPAFCLRGRASVLHLLPLAILIHPHPSCQVSKKFHPGFNLNIAVLTCFSLDLEFSSWKYSKMQCINPSSSSRSVLPSERLMTEGRSAAVVRDKEGKSRYDLHVQTIVQGQRKKPELLSRLLTFLSNPLH